MRKRQSVALSLPCILVLIVTAYRVEAQVHDPRALEANPASATEQIAPELDGLGDYHMAVTTSSPRSQEFFDQGLRLTYGFNHSEALRSFKEAARLDPNNAMAYWGWALVLGPNLNLPMVPEVVPQAYEAVEQAIARKGKVSEKEKDFIEALAKRYTDDPDADRAPFDRAYADAMGLLSKKYPDDLEAATLYGASLMNLSPWNYWNKDGSPKGYTAEIVSTFESVIARDAKHVGAHHYYIHIVEAVHPERGVKSADLMTGLTPGAGHLVHMPSHIYMRVGRYADSFEANVKASEADENYISSCRAQGMYPLTYYPHNVHFVVWAAMFQGKSEEAMAASRKIEGKIPNHLKGDTWGLFDSFLSQPLYTMVRFGKWEEILNEPKPIPVTPFRTGVWHYARALALVHTGGRGARRELNALREIIDSAELEGHNIGFSAAPKLLSIAAEIVDAEISAKKGKYLEASARLGRAVRLEDGLLYNEPPDWYFPVRHFLGAVLLEAGHPEEAEVVYWEDLRKAPDNGYSLFGLKQALTAQGRLEEAAAIGARFQKAWSAADVTLTSSRY
jgi:tetratricopeptide (TPR) repeat protein